MFELPKHNSTTIVLLLRNLQTDGSVKYCLLEQNANVMDLKGLKSGLHSNVKTNGNLVLT